MKKKGFTLIELLAVLVILAILALITIPIVLSIIRNAKENSYARSIESYGRAVETAVMEYQMNNEDSEVLKNTIPDYKEYIKISRNDVVCDDTIQDINSDKGITLTNCKVVDKNGTKKSKYTYKYHNGKATKEESQNNGQQEEPTYTAYSVGDEITVAGEQYYVISDSGVSQDYVTALKANPLTVDEINTFGEGHINNYTYNNVGAVYVINDNNNTGGIAYYTSANCGFNDGFVSGGCYSENANSYLTSDIRYVVDGWKDEKFNQDDLRKVDGYDARLIKIEELVPFYAQCDLSSNCPKQEDTPTWLYNSNYFYYTMSPTSDNSTKNTVWCILEDGKLSLQRGVDSSGGAVRPVINVYKSAIQN